MVVTYRVLQEFGKFTSFCIILFIHIADSTKQMCKAETLVL